MLTVLPTSNRVLHEMVTSDLSGGVLEPAANEGESPDLHGGE